MCNVECVALAMSWHGTTPRGPPLCGAGHVFCQQVVHVLGDSTITRYFSPDTFRPQCLFSPRPLQHFSPRRSDAILSYLFLGGRDIKKKVSQVFD